LPFSFYPTFGGFLQESAPFLLRRFFHTILANARQVARLGQFVGEHLLNCIVRGKSQYADYFRRHKVPIFHGDLAGIVNQLAGVMRDRKLVRAHRFHVNAALVLLDSLENVLSVLQLSRGVIDDIKEAIIFAH